MGFEPLPGKGYPLGATVYDTGVNFSVFSKNCASVDLLLFDHQDDDRPSRVIPMDPKRNRTFYYWHVFIPGIGHGQLYGYRVGGPYAPKQGLRFDGDKLLIDPYARAVAPSSRYSRSAAIEVGDNCGQGIKSVAVDPDLYEWGKDDRIDQAYANTVIYEMHVRGFTQHPSSGVAASRRGTYLGVIDKIPYLKSLGITAVELLPVQQFDPQDAPDGLVNYWGYGPIALFAPHQGYATATDPLCAMNEFRDMVRALHAAGIEVILDVVFNHSGEGGSYGPTLSFRGLENRAYYMLQEDRAYYANYSGTGNTLNANHSVVRRMIMDCLRYWVSEMHVDGFRFDLASVMARDEEGRPMKNPPILWEIESDPILGEAKIIAEAWDAAGLYQVGSFIGRRWAEWNAHFRDDVRRFVKSDPGVVRDLAFRIHGSRDLYQKPDRNPNHSINFVTAHDGFTLKDLVSYNVKHNEPNLENNTDGLDTNYSWNCGTEGPTSDSAILALRSRQVRNLLVILLVAQGTPMIRMGDEIGHTQAGNNNAYCQDNPLTWFDWRDVEVEAHLLRFVRELIRLTQGLAVCRQEAFWSSTNGNGYAVASGLPAANEGPAITWHGVRLNEPDWGDVSRSLAFELCALDLGEHVYVILNAYWEPLVFELPPLEEDMIWHRVVDTSFAPPDEILPLSEAVAVTGGTYEAGGRAAVMLVAKRT